MVRVFTLLFGAVSGFVSLVVSAVLYLVSLVGVISVLKSSVGTVSVEESSIGVISVLCH